MKKATLVMLVLVLALCTCVLAGCTVDPPHEHTYGEEWSNDATGHWKACSGCTEKQNFAEHIPAEPVEENVNPATCNAKGSKDIVVYCSVCNIEISRQTGVEIDATGAHNYNYANAVYAQVGENQHKIKCKDCDTYGEPVNCAPLADDGDCTTPVLCACGRAVISAKEEHTYTGNPVWTNQQGIFTATYACDVEGCTKAPKTVAITVPAVAGVEAVNQVADNGNFKFSLALEEGYYIVSVKVGETDLEVTDGVYSAPIAEATVAIVVSNLYEIRFLDFDDTPIGDAMNLAYGATVTPPADPQRGQTESIVYTFNGWTPAVVNVAGNATYKATYSESARKYTITWKNGDAETTTQVAYGTVSAYTGDTPVKTADAQYSYAFSSWSPAPVAVTGDATYTATFASTVNKYTVKFLDADGVTVLQEGMVEYGTVPAYTGDTLPEYAWHNFERGQLAGWDKAIVAVTGDATYTASYDLLYEYGIFAMRGDAVSTTKPNCGGYNVNFAVSTQANIQQTNKYRVVLLSSVAGNADYREHDSICFTFMVNYSGMVFTTVDGQELFTSIANTKYQMIVDSEGKVYIQGFLMDGITMQNGEIAFNVERDADAHQYAFIEITEPAYDVEPKTEYMNQLDDFYITNANGTKTVAPATNDERFAMGITSVTTFTAGVWQENALNDFDLTRFNEVKFYVFRISSGNIKIDGQGLTPNDGKWFEIKLVKNGASFDVFVNGVMQNLTSNVTNLNQFIFNVNVNCQVKYSNILVDTASYIAPSPFTPVAGSIFGDATVVAAPASVPNVAIPGLEVYTYTMNGFGNRALSNIDLMQYDEVMFFVKRVANVDGGDIRTNSDGGSTGRFIDMSDCQWHEFHLVKNSAGTGFDVYVDGALSSMKFYIVGQDRIAANEIPLTNMKQFALNGTSGEFLLTNMFVYVAPKEFTPITDKAFADATIVAAPASLPETDFEGVEVYTYTMNDWDNRALNNIALMQYDEVMFFVKRVANVNGGDIRTNSDGGSAGRFIDMSDCQWHEFHLVKNSAGTGFDVYVDGALSSVKFYTDNNKATEIPLTNMNQFALNGTSFEFLFSNIFAC